MYDAEFKKRVIKEVVARAGTACRMLFPLPLSATIEEIALKFEISGSTVRSWLSAELCESKEPEQSREERKRKRDLGKEARRIESGCDLTREHIEFIKDLLYESPGLTNEDLGLCLFICYNTFFSRRKIGDAVHKEGWTSKAMEHFAKEMSVPLVYFFGDNIHCIEANQFVYADGTTLNPTQCQRKIGRSPKGTPAVETKTLSLPPGLNESGMSAFFAMSIEGPLSVSCDAVVTKESMNVRFERDVFPVMNPFPQPRSVLVVDNCPNHDKVFIVQKASEYGVKVLFLPAYAPRMNPTEPCHALAKKYIRRTYGRYCKPFEILFKEAYFTVITPDVAIQQFERVGHHVKEWEREWANR